MSECVFIEDSIVGIRVTKEAKMKCATVFSGISSRSKIIPLKPNLIVCSLFEKDENLKVFLEK